MKIAFVVSNHVSDTGLNLAMDAFVMANRLRAQLATPVAPYTLEVVSDSRHVVTQRGLRLATVPARRAQQPDVAVVAAPGVNGPIDVDAHLAMLARGPLTALLASWSQQGVLVASACAGTFTLAAAGLLGGVQATTAWWLADHLKARFPTVQVAEKRMLVRHGNVVTAGAFLGHLDVALWLIRQQSVQLADLTARYLVATPGVSQAPYIIPQHTQHTDPQVAEFERLTRDNLHAPLPMGKIAKKCGLSERTLHRRIQAAFGRSPLAQIQEWRMQTAIQLLNATAASVEDVASQVGYGSATVLRTLVKRRLGIGLRSKIQAC